MFYLLFKILRFLFFHFSVKNNEWICCKNYFMVRVNIPLTQYLSGSTPLSTLSRFWCSQRWHIGGFFQWSCVSTEVSLGGSLTQPISPTVLPSRLPFFSTYVGYWGWLPPSPSSVPSLIPFPHFWQTDRDRSGPDLDCSSSKRNLLCSPKHGETELEQIQKELGDPISDQIGSGDGWSSTCTIETGWRWSRTAFPILNSQHTLTPRPHLVESGTVWVHPIVSSD